MDDEDAKPKVKIYHIDESGNIAFRSERKSGEVRIPNYVYDLWLPLLGIETIGVYTLYCRLEREATVKAITQDRIAKLCKIGKVKLREINDRLQECGFITVKVPKGRARANHHTTEIVVKDPPPQIDALLIRTHQSHSGYEPLTTWLCEVENHEMYRVLPCEVPDRTSRSSEQNVVEVPDRTSTIVTSLSVTSLEVEKGKETSAPNVAVMPEHPETNIVKEITPALPEGNGKILAFASAKETTEDTPPRKSRKPNKNEPMYNALIEQFGLSGITMTKGAASAYWKVAAELSEFPLDRVTELYKYVRRKSQAEKWNTFTVNALAKYAPDFLRDNPRKTTIIIDESALPKASAETVGGVIAVPADRQVAGEAVIANLLANWNSKGLKRASGE
jgi:hypothetical protein